MTTEELNKAIKFLKEKGIFLKKTIKFESGSIAEVRINSFHENHKTMEVTASWGSLDFQGSEKVWDLEHPNEEEYRDLM